MKKIFITTLSILLFCSCKNYNLEINPEYRIALNSYTKNDTIYFENQFGDLDTIKIVSIDSIKEIPIIANTHPHKTINLRIEHLPKNNWKELQLYGDPTKPELQPMISVDNSFEKCCDVIIEFRDFKGYLSKIDNRNFSKTDTINADEPNTDKNSINTVYWNFTKGIIGYKKNNGDEFKLKNKY